MKNRKGRHPWNLRARKNGGGENGEDEVAASSPCRPNLRSPFTPCHSELQNCHSEPQNYKNVTLGLKC